MSMSVLMPVSDEARRFEVFTGEGRRRRFSAVEKAAIVAESYEAADLSRPVRGDLVAFARGVAVVAAKDRLVVSALADEMRRRRIIIPGVTVLERLTAQAAPRPKMPCWPTSRGG